MSEIYILTKQNLVETVRKSNASFDELSQELDMALLTDETIFVRLTDKLSPTGKHYLRHKTVANQMLNEKSIQDFIFTEEAWL